jgi:hypothetical protein
MEQLVFHFVDLRGNLYLCIYGKRGQTIEVSLKPDKNSGRMK